MCEEDGLPRREEDLDELEALEEDREGASFSSSSAKLRSFFGAWLGLATAEDEEGFDMALTTVVEGALSSSSSSARRRKFLALLLIVAVNSLACRTE